MKNNDFSTLTETASIDNIYESFLPLFGHLVHCVPITLETVSIAHTTSECIQKRIDSIQEHMNMLTVELQVLMSIKKRLKKRVDIYLQSA